MEFWGVEVKPGESLKVTPEPDHIIHVSQAALGDVKNRGNEMVPLFVKFDNKKLVLGTLSFEKFPQLSFDLVFEKEFEVSHSWKNGSLYLTGYKSAIPEDNFNEYGSDDDDEDEEEDVPMIEAANGDAKPKIEKAKPADKKAKPVEASKPNKTEEEEESDEDDNSDEEDDESDYEGDSDEEDAEGDDDSDEDDSEGEDEETPEKAAPPSKKRNDDSAMKTPSGKKAKPSTPQKSDGKKNAHTATPHPAKQSGKPAKTAIQTPKSGVQFSCKPCGKSFGSDSALQSHTKAKHAGK